MDFIAGRNELVYFRSWWMFKVNATRSLGAKTTARYPVSNPLRYYFFLLRREQEIQIKLRNAK